MNGEMKFLKEHLSAKENPSSYYDNLISAIVIAKSYSPHPWEHQTRYDSLRIAKYAKGNDYHCEIKKILNLIAAELKTNFPEENFWPSIDTGPILERNLAFEAGLGWVGKNTCLIDKKAGSYFFIGEILTSINLKPIQETAKNHCGTCTRCIDACPTRALVAPNVLDARLCISYLNIEAPGAPEEHLRPLMGDWFFGCDICQDVCPWNKKQESPLPTPVDNREQKIKAIEYLLTQTHRQIERDIKDSPLVRAGARGLKRNALMVIANLNLFELKPLVETLVGHEFFGDLAIWALARLKLS